MGRISVQPAALVSDQTPVSKNECISGNSNFHGLLCSVEDCMPWWGCRWSVHPNEFATCTVRKEAFRWKGRQFCTGMQTAEEEIKCFLDSPPCNVLHVCVSVCVWMWTCVMCTPPLGSRETGKLMKVTDVTGLDALSKFPVWELRGRSLPPNSPPSSTPNQPPSLSLSLQTFSHNPHTKESQ